MVHRAVYLAVYSRSARQRAHFSIFKLNESANARDLSNDASPEPAKGTIIHVVGEPVMNGYRLEFKRNYDCKASRQLQKLVPLGYVDGANVTDPTTEQFSTDSIPRSTLEQVATRIPPPPGDQNVRAPIDGVTTRRCQDWTKEYIQELKDRGLISPGAPEKVEEERDPPTHGIFGYGGEGANR